MTDLLQGMIDRGNALTAVPVRRGWFEIDSIRDLEVAQWALAAVIVRSGSSEFRAARTSMRGRLVPEGRNGSKIGLPDWVRWLGVGIGVLCTLGIYWLFSSIGSGITPTSATRQKHMLVTRGPYRWVRHPLYTFGSSMFVAFGMMADNWFIALLGVLAFIAMATRTPKEEANLIEKFGDEYREYMKRTGRFLPKF